MCYLANMDEETVLRQIKVHMAAAGISQLELGRRIAPESKNPGQSINQYLTGRRSLFTGTGRDILDALGLEVVIQPKASQHGQ